MNRTTTVTSRRWSLYLLGLLALAAAVVAALRLSRGLGATTNLSDDWPWGLWKGFNVMVLIALGAGGFGSAGLAYVFGGRRYRPLAHSAVLWALLCYLAASLSLVVDIGVPWRIVHPLWMWSGQSLLFEVAWCIIVYLSVLVLELAPAALERFSGRRPGRWWEPAVSGYAALALAGFTYVMTRSAAWAGAVLALLVVARLTVARRAQVPAAPLLVVGAGIVLSVLHQSSLGSLFLLVPEKLSHLWWSPRLPLNFLLSALAAGLAVVLLLPHPSAGEDVERLRTELARVVAWLAGAALAVRLVDLAVVTAGPAGRQAWQQLHLAALLVAELGLGWLLPVMLLASARRRRSNLWRTLAALLLAGGVTLNRLAVCFWGMNQAGGYRPSTAELVLAVGTLAGVVLAHRLGSGWLAAHHGEQAARASDGSG